MKGMNMVDNNLQIQEMIDMPMMTIGSIGEDIRLIRVPGGWIFRLQEGISIAAVFVPEPEEAKNNGDE